MGDSCGCRTNSALLFACSGASDTGAITDLAARRLTLEGKGKMTCLAQVGANNESVIANARKSDNVLVLDGCASDCAGKILESAGIAGFKRLRLSDHGFKKGLSPANGENVEKAARLGESLLMPQKNETGGCCG